MRKEQARYWTNIYTAFQSLKAGLKLTFRHLLTARHSVKSVSISSPDYFFRQRGIATIQYPHQILPVPDTGRYRLHNQIDDCIVCDKCAKICPVNCITIEPIKAVEQIGKTSDGTPKRIYAATFDINMAQCCFCGLCTTVCPTECLTMTKVYDFSVCDITEHTYAFSEMTPAEIQEKKSILEAHQQAKARVAPPLFDSETDTNPSQPSAKPNVKPIFKPPGSAPPVL